MQTVPYGAWPSPLTASQVASASLKLEDVQIAGASVYWAERRPQERGRTALCRLVDGQPQLLTPAPCSVRSRVHEYGGAAFLATTDTLYYVQHSDQRWYARAADGTVSALTDDGGAVRYADPCLHRKGLLLVQEDHRGAGEPVNRLVRLEGSQVHTVLEGADFYAAPAVHGPTGHWAALSWNHPHMPWDSTSLWVDTGNGPRVVAGGPGESIVQPQWGPDGTLYFVSDRSGWWNLWAWDGATSRSLLPMEAEFGRPQWVFGVSQYAVADDGLVCSWFDGARWRLGRLQHRLQAYDVDFSDIRQVRSDGRYAWFLGDAPNRPSALVRLELQSGQSEVLYEAGPPPDARYCSIPQSVQFRTRDGGVGYARYYPPTHAEAQAPAHERPPLLVKSHGGPTSATTTALNLEIQYWTSRGVAVLDVDYGGSTGHGRPYRERLRGQWGIVDVQDCADAALAMVARGRADADRLAIDGKSAGGFTTLSALTFTTVFKAGASLYGVSDLQALARDTHKFESRYMDALVGPWPQAQAVYRERSPIWHVDRLSCPVILLQGTEDQVVPPNQAQMMYEALRRKGLPVALLWFEGEDHGFRQAASLQRALEAEFLFLARVFGFEPADDLPPLDIDNLEAAV